MLAEPAGQSANSTDPIVYLISDTGERYLVSGTQALGALGYSSVGPVVLPGSVLGLIPSGPELDIDAAAQAVS
jgi:hypothetical protein